MSFTHYLTFPIMLFSQAVPYSREFKQKYDYFRKKLKKPVRPVLFTRLEPWGFV